MSFEIVHQLRKSLDNLRQEHNGYLLNCIPSPYDPRDYKYLHLIGTLAEEPVTPVDYREDLPPVFDQGPRGSCVACVSTWTLKAYEEIKQGDYPEGGLSTSFLYAMCKKNDGIPFLEGTQPKVAVQILQKYGVCSEEVMPYSRLTELPAPLVPDIPEQAMEAAAAFKIQTYAQLCSPYDISRNHTIAAMREALKREGPFMIALLVCENFVPDKNYRLPFPAGEIQGGHAVGIVGDLPDHQCFILRNSWGTGWGENGYAYLPYEWITRKTDTGWAVFEAWTTTDVTTSKPAAQIVLTSGINSMKVDGKRVMLEEPIILSRAFASRLPIRILADKMGYKVDWQGSKVIFSKKI
ncbi:MAG: C1 family peptidase [Syntrophomonadaceae bacterium]|jgi:hypothetical protein